MKEPIKLALFQDQLPKTRSDEAIPFYLPDYLELVDWSGRAQLENKRGSINDQLPPILDRLGFDQDRWFKSMKLHQQSFPMIGPPDQIRAAAEQQARHWFRGITRMGLFAKN